VVPETVNPQKPLGRGFQLPRVKEREVRECVVQLELMVTAYWVTVTPEATQLEPADCATEIEDASQLEEPEPVVVAEAEVAAAVVAWVVVVVAAAVVAWVVVVAAAVVAWVVVEVVAAAVVAWVVVVAAAVVA